MFDAPPPAGFADGFGSFSSTQANTAHPSDRDLQRANGCARVVLSGSEEGTRVIEVYQRSPVRILFPRACDRMVKEAVLVNTAGGIAGGDSLRTTVIALSDASIAVTSQAAEKVYRALNAPAYVTTRLKACRAARLAWIPQETIVFNSARISRKTEIELGSGAELLALEWLVLGRAAHGEQMVSGQIADSWRVKKDGRLIWMDTFRITDAMFPDLHRKALLSNFSTLATLVYFGLYLETRMSFLRELARSLDCHCAATSVGGLIIVRFAAQASSSLRLGLRHFLEQLSCELGPGPFRAPKMWLC